MQDLDLVVVDLAREMLLTVLMISGPLLVVGLIVGVAVSLFQALTSVQEMTLTFVPKVGLMLAVFWVTMSFMTATLGSFFTGRILPLVAGG